jgi:tetratricopeptide (TPR) repeat protein
VIGLLAPVPQLRVLPRNTVFRYKGWEGDPLAAGRELGARGVLTGRVLTYGEKVIVRAELVDTEQNCQVWGERYARPLADLTALEDEIAGQICEALRHCLSGSPPPAARRRTTQDTKAYHLYLKARYLWNKRTPGALVRAVEYFEQAIGRDPDYALAYSGLADCYVVLGCQLDYAFLPIREAYEKAEAAARRALALDESLAEAHASLADVTKSYRWDWKGAEREFQRSIELNPRYATAHHWYAFLLSALGRLDEALREIRLAHELDPYHLMINTDFAKIWYYAREYDRAADQLRLTLDLDPDFVPARTLLGLVYRFQGIPEEAEAELNRAFRLAGRDILPIVSFGQLLGYAREDHRRRGVGELEELAQFRYVPACCWAALYLCQDQYDRAFEWLEKAFEERSNWLVHLNTDPIFDPLRNDARFKSLVRRVGLPE